MQQQNFRISLLRSITFYFKFVDRCIMDQDTVSCWMFPKCDSFSALSILFLRLPAWLLGCDGDSIDSLLFCYSFNTPLTSLPCCQSRSEFPLPLFPGAVLGFTAGGEGHVAVCVSVASVSLVSLLLPWQTSLCEVLIAALCSRKLCMLLVQNTCAVAVVCIRGPLLGQSHIQTHSSPSVCSLFGVLGSKWKNFVHCGEYSLNQS